MRDSPIPFQILDLYGTERITASIMKNIISAIVLVGVVLVRGYDLEYCVSRYPQIKGFAELYPLNLPHTCSQAIATLFQGKFEFAVAESLLQIPQIGQVGFELLKRLRGLFPSKINLGLTFGTDDPGVTGFVGRSTNFITQILSGHGNIRETMTLVYIAIHRNQFAVSKRIKALLFSEYSESPYFNRSFALQHYFSELTSGDLDLFQKYNGHPRKCFIPFFVPGGSVRQCRCVQNENMSCRKRQMNESLWYSQLYTDQITIPPVSPREYQTILSSSNHQCANGTACPVMWIPGGNLYEIPRQSDNPNLFYPHSNQIRQVSGPSSTTFSFLQASNYVSFDIMDLYWLRLSLLVWMVPAGDHSIYEIMQASTCNGLDYDIQDRTQIFSKIIPESFPQKGILLEHIARYIANAFYIPCGRIYSPSTYLEYLTAKQYYRE